VAYVYDPDDEFAAKANTGMVSLSDSLEESDRRMLKRLVENHAAYTDSDRAAWMLEAWDDVREDFVKVMPDAYAEVIEERARDDVRQDLPPAATATADADEGEAAVQTSDD
jgi:glutamate synthase (NADPH/NADH) large chain